MDQFGLAKQCQAIEQLLRKYSHECGTQTTELVLLDQLVQVNAEQLKDKAKMLPVDERVLQAQEMVVVVFVHLLVQLGKCQRASDKMFGKPTRSKTDTSIMLWLK